jgi:crotonobetainyl-CoA:carnitine CoA-transferase CaiB-like acyl-CoA transferase
MSETPPKITRPAPLIGEHGYEILEEFGYSVNDIKEFENENIISVERIQK